MSLYLRLRNAGRALLGRDPLIPGNPYLNPVSPGDPWYYVNDRRVTAEEAQARWQAHQAHGAIQSLLINEEFSLDLPYKDENPDIPHLSPGYQDLELLAPYLTRRDHQAAERLQAGRNRPRGLRHAPEPPAPLSRAQGEHPPGWDSRTPGDATDPDAWDHHPR